MSCNHDANCKNIANSYREVRGELETNFSSLSQSVSEIDAILNGLEIPDDYLGGKIRQKLSGIKTDFAEDSASIEAEKSNVVRFTQTMEEDHNNHYQQWIREQELKRRREETITEQ